MLANLLGPSKPIISCTVLEDLIVEHESGIMYNTINELLFALNATLSIATHQFALNARTMICAYKCTWALLQF